MIKSLSFLVSIFAISSVQAAVSLEPVGVSVKTITENGVAVNVTKEAKLHFGDKTYSVYLSGAGVRQKTIFFIPTKLYIATSYTDLQEGISFDDAIGSVKKSGVRVMQLTMTDNLSAGLARGSFKEILDYNNIDTKAKAIKDVLDAIKDDLVAKTVINVVGFSDVASPTGHELVYAEFGKAPITSEAPNVALEFWHVWFGNPKDDELKALKKDLTTKL